MPQSNDDEPTERDSTPDTVDPSVPIESEFPSEPGDANAQPT